MALNSENRYTGGKTTSNIYFIVKFGKRRNSICHIDYRHLINIYWNKTVFEKF